MLNMLILQSAKLGSKWKEEKAKLRQIADNQAKMFSKGQRLNYRSFICNTLIFRRVEHLRGKVENVN